MAESGAVAVLGGFWGRDHDERGFVVRAVAAAISRVAAVEVMVPGPPGPRRPDGAIDLHLVGGTPPAHGLGAGWPDPAEARWPTTGPISLVVIEGGDDAARALVETSLPGVPVARVVSSPRDEEATGGGAPELAVGAGRPPAGDGGIGLHVPAHRLAAARGHVGIGFTDYLLVLGDRGPEAAGADAPTALAAWLAARFAERHVVVVENALATVWRARSRRGVLSVDTRTDLWRLLAHARLTVDLSPGPLIARECVESLLYGVPVVVPEGTTGARLAALGGGLWFDDEAGLLGCVEALDDQRMRDILGEQGRAVTSRWYGDAAGFVHRVSDALAGLGVLRPAV